MFWLVVHACLLRFPEGRLRAFLTMLAVFPWLMQPRHHVSQIALFITPRSVRRRAQTRFYRAYACILPLVVRCYCFFSYFAVGRFFFNATLAAISKYYRWFYCNFCHFVAVYYSCFSYLYWQNHAGCGQRTSCYCASFFSTYGVACKTCPY